MSSAQMPQVARKARGLLLAVFLPVALLSGCRTAEGTGALVGSGLGAVAGNALAKSGGMSRTAGTAIGGIAGAVGGALVGGNVDKANARADRAEARANAVETAAVQQAQLGLPEVVQLAQQGVTDGVIINQIRSSGAVYRLSSQDILWLKQNAVSDTVIAEMQATATRPVRQVYTPVPVYQSAPVYVVQPPPPRGMSVGFGYHSRGR